MRSSDTRAIENIAAAPATLADRRWALTTVVTLIAVCVLSIPFAARRLVEVPAFVPTVVGAGIVALVLTAVLLYVQYRIERDLKLALLAIAYGVGAVTQVLYLLTFPRAFSEGGLLGAGPQTSSWFYISSQAGFGALIIAEGLAARFGWRASRRTVRAIAVGTALFLTVLTLLFTLGRDHLPVITHETLYAHVWRDVVAPLIVAELLIALAIVSDRLRTVTDVWLSVVLLGRTVSVATAGELSSGRFSVGWYAARIEELVAAVVVLCVFLVKINDVMLRLAARSRSTAEALAVGEARYSSLANVVPQLIWTTNDRGDIEYVNDRWVAYTGFDLNAFRDAGWRAVLHPDHEPLFRARWEQSVQTGEPFAEEYLLRGVAAERYRWFLVNGVPVRGRPGGVVAWIGTCTDVDAQKRLDEREAFLARAGERLGASLDVTATVAAITKLPIPRLADRTWAALRDDDGRYVFTGLGSTEPADEVTARRWTGLPLQPALHETIARAVAAGDAVVADRDLRFPDPWAHELMAGRAMIAPLVSGEAAIGALVLSRTGDGTYDEGDVTLVREFTRRAALSLQHARLYQRERTTADALQRAMLPAALPVLPDIRFSASYSAASESQRVGGDFYDAFELPDGRVAVTIGDVTGHGLEAAVIMGEIRQALRAASFESAVPSAILDRASRLLVASGRSVFVTAIVGVIDPVSGRFTYATAGHPPPLLDDAHGLRRLPSAGLPIGLRDEQGVDFVVRLHAPCTLVMFTDGLMEFARDLDAGERRIEQAIRALAHDQIDHLAAALMTHVLGDDEPTDDIAILTASIERFSAELPGEEREWHFVSDDARTGAAVRRDVGELVASWSGREDARFGSELAFGELIANAVRHAPGPVRVIAATDDHGGATLTVEDSGTGFTDEDHRNDPFAESGRGLNLVRAIADDVRIEAVPQGGTRVIVSFHGAHAALATSA